MDRPLTRDEETHLLVRTTFAAHPKGRTRLKEIGLARFVDELLEFRVNTPVEVSADKEIRDKNWPKDYELVHWWLRLMVRSEQPFQEVLAFFWHDHFASAQRVLESGGRYMFKDQVQLFRRLGSGNLRDLMQAVMKDPAMLIWLDGISNTKEKPNENLAREWFELFALGVDNGYTQQDIQEAARALSGYRLIDDRRTSQDFVIFDRNRHDTGEKTVFGVTGNFNTESLVNLTIDQRQVAEHISRKMFDYFAYERPSARVVTYLARVLRSNNYELKPLLRAILTSKAFFSSTARTGRIKSPVEYAVGFIRSTSLEMRFDDLSEFLASLGQQPTQPPNVAGWPTGLHWISPQAMLERGNVVNESITSRDHQFRMGFGLNELLPPRDERTAANIVDGLIDRMAIKVTGQERALYLEYLSTKADLKKAKNGIEELVLEEDEFDAGNSRHLDERVRGLIFVMSQHPSFYLR